MTLPFHPFSEARLEIGDRVRFRADGPGRVIIERIEAPDRLIPETDDAGASVRKVADPSYNPYARQD